MNVYRFLNDTELDDYEVGRQNRILQLKIQLLEKETELEEIRREQKERKDKR